MSGQPPAELIERHETFLSRGPADRPITGAWLGGYFPAEQFPRGTSAWTSASSVEPRDGQLLSPADVTLPPFGPDYENLYRLGRAIDDDFFYVGSAYWGVPWLEAILGCPVRAGATTCWAEACLGLLADVPRTIGNLDDNGWLQCLVRFTEELVALSAGRFPVCPPLLRGPGDAACAMRGAMHLVPEFIDEPDAVQRLLEHCTAVREEVVRRVSQVIPSWHGTHAAGGYPSRLWCRRTVAYNQEDSLALLSPDLFRRFLLPLHRRMCRSAEVNFIHLHSACLWPVDILLADGPYDVLEINIDHEGAGPPLRDLISTFQRIQSAGKPLLLWGEIQPDDWRMLGESLSPVGLAIQPIVADRERRGW
jgi:hypothetical protein